MVTAAEVWTSHTAVRPVSSTWRATAAESMAYLLALIPLFTITIVLQIVATLIVIYRPSLVLDTVNSGKPVPVVVDNDAMMPPSMD